jgi:hypothetical protein
MHLRRAIVVCASAAMITIAAAFACGPGSLDDLTGGKKDTGAADVTPDVAPVDAGCGGQERGVVPPRPQGVDDGTSVGGVFGITYAFDNLRLDNADTDASLSAPKSLDLDHQCTCPEPSSCTPPDSGANLCDGLGGRDNSAAGLLAGLVTVVPNVSPNYLRKRIRDGGFNVLIHVVGWNGKPDDQKVGIDIKGSPSWDYPKDDAGNPVVDEAGVPLNPAFDGNDFWNVDSASIANGKDFIGANCSDDAGTVFCIPLNIAIDAYVSGGVLVAFIDKVPLSLRTDTGRFQVDFAAVTLVAKITTTSLDGEIAGRWNATTLLRNAQGIINPLTDAGLCPGDPLYATFKEALCNSVDLAADAAADNTGAACAAISEALHFTAVPAHAGHVKELTGQSSGCPDATVDDSCEKP